MGVDRDDQLGAREENHRTPEGCFGIAQIVQAVDGVLYDLWGANQQVPQWRRFGDGWSWVRVRGIDNHHR